jgi:hypothetical protein
MEKPDLTMAQQVAEAAAAFEKARTGHTPQAVTVVLADAASWRRGAPHVQALRGERLARDRHLAGWGPFPRLNRIRTYGQPFRQG